MTQRQRISLDGTWQFHHDPTGNTGPTGNAGPAAIQNWRSAQVPLPWQAQFDDLRLVSGVAWYRRIFTLDRAPQAAAILHFGAVEYLATVWVNGHKVGEHEGGYLPFEFDVAGQLVAGENEIVVRAVDPDDDRGRWAEMPFSEIPHGKQSWYGPIGGLWQSVWLELRPAVHIRSLRLTPNVAAGAIQVTVAYGAATPAPGSQVQVAVLDPQGKQVAAATLDAGGQGSVQLEQAQVTLWSPDTPALYTVVAALVDAGVTVDEAAATCGFRTIEARAGRIYLNGRPIYLRGVLDQAYYPETIYTPPSVEFLEDQVRKAKALGLNCLRCHIKVEDPRYYEVADRLGILIWTEIPNWEVLTPASSARGKAVFQGMVARDWNHPSIFAWTLINENWGTDLVNNPEHRRWLADFYHEAKAIDPTRLIVDNSACNYNFHVAGDLDDYHIYYAIPDHAAHFDAWLDEFAQHADWAWAEDYRHERRADLPLILSEFGNWGLPNPAAIQEQGKDPWWFETGYERDVMVYPHAMPKRFAYWGLDAVFGDLDAFTRAHQLHMAHSLAYQLTSMRLNPKVGGYIITEFTDVHWECNGLMTMQRQIKDGLHEIFVPLNQDRVVAVRPQRWSGVPGDELSVLVQALDVDGAGQGGSLRWHAGSVEGELAAPGGEIHVHLARAGMIPLTVQWIDDGHQVLAQSTVELACIDLHSGSQRLQVVDDPDFARLLDELGYQIVAGDAADPSGLLIARHYTPAVRAAIQAGARALIIAGTDFNTQGEVAHLPRGRIIARAGTPWQGDWATSFSWLKKQGPFNRLPGSPFLEMEYAELMPDAVWEGIPPYFYQKHSWAGLALGWIHRPVSLLATVPYGRGQLTLTTFKLTAESLANRAVGQALFAGIVELALG